eukprot:15128684-Alexandrium_andersonii.AAC.1
MSASLVGSEMCIRDRLTVVRACSPPRPWRLTARPPTSSPETAFPPPPTARPTRLGLRSAGPPSASSRSQRARGGSP